MDPTAFDAKPSRCDPSDCFRVGLAFSFEYPGRKRLRRIVIMNRYGALKEDRAGIVRVIRKVDRAAADAGTAGQHRGVNMSSVHPVPAERRQQRRMNVQHAMMEVRRDLNEMQPARQTDPIRLKLPDRGKDGFGKRLGRATPRDHLEGNPFMMSPGQDIRFVRTADDPGDFRGQPTVPDVPDQIL